MDDNLLKHFTAPVPDSAITEALRELAAKTAAIGPGKFPEIKSEWTRMSPENEARVAELLAIEAAKTELRKVAMVLHNEARAVLQNVFLCPDDVNDAVSHILAARRAITDTIDNLKPIQ